MRMRRRAAGCARGKVFARGGGRMTHGHASGYSLRFPRIAEVPAVRLGPPDDVPRPIGD